jgi:hypothetical protein
VKETRKVYKKYTNSLTSTMTEERLAQLRKANFPLCGYLGTPTSTKSERKQVQSMAVKKNTKSISPKQHKTKKIKGRKRMKRGETS